jgi:8-oxo-dGTP diphosphatase
MKEPTVRDMTVCFLIRHTPAHQVLLGFKKRRFAAGKYAGIGGHVEADKTIRSAASRELYEETGILASSSDLQTMGEITFRFPNRPTWDQIVHVFLVTRWTGEASESEEMRPAWYPIDALPFAQMWDDGRYWLRQMLAAQPLQAQISYADDNATVCDVLLATPLTKPLSKAGGVVTIRDHPSCNSYSTEHNY